MEKILIYGKPTCPHTRRALESTPGAVFVDVLADEANMATMLKLSQGRRRIPVIVKNGETQVGFRGGS